ncbi:MAG: hypothetical protein Q9182_002480 [Xanthomendoza sp. 2 TL-2023]
MAFMFIFQLSLFLLARTAFAHNQTMATTLQPVFAPPFDATSTIYATTATVQSAVDCSGSLLVVSTFSGTIADVATNTATATSPATTSTKFACLSSATTTSRSSISASTPSVSPPTAVPPPPINGTGQMLIDELRTAILYVSLIGNDANLAKLCSVINPAALFNETGINGTAVQTEVCSAAAIAQFLPGLAQTVVLSNQVGVSYLQTALFAVQAVSRFAGCTNRTMLCNEIDETVINNLFIAYINGTGTAIKRPPPVTHMGQVLSVYRDNARSIDIQTLLASLAEAYPCTKTLQFRISIGFLLGPSLIGTACKYLAGRKDTSIDQPASHVPKTAVGASSDASTQTDDVVDPPLLAVSETTTAKGGISGEQDFLIGSAGVVPAGEIAEGNGHHGNMADDGRPLEMAKSAADLADHHDGRNDQSIAPDSLGPEETNSSGNNRTAVLVENLHAALDRLKETVQQQRKIVEEVQIELDDPPQYNLRPGLEMSISRLNRRADELRRKAEHDHARGPASSHGEGNEDETSELDEVPLALAQTFEERLPTVVPDASGVRGAFKYVECREWLDDERAGRKADAEKAESEIADAKLQWSEEKAGREAEAEKAESEIAEARLQWSKEKDELVARHRTEIGRISAAYRIAIDSLKKDLQTFDIQVDELRIDQLDKSQEVKELKTKLDDMERLAESREKETRAREDEVRRTEQQMSAHYTALEDKYTQELATTQDKLESQQRSISALQTEATSQTAVVEELRKSNKTKDKDNQALKAENKALKNRIAKSKTQFDSFKRLSQLDAAERDAEIAKLEADNERAQAEYLRLICCIPLPGSTHPAAFEETPSYELIPLSNDPATLASSSSSGSNTSQASTTEFVGSLLDTDVPLEFPSSGAFSALPGNDTHPIEHGAMASIVDEPVLVPSLPFPVLEADSGLQHGEIKTSGPLALSSTVDENSVVENINGVPEQPQQSSSTSVDVATLPLNQITPETDSSDIAATELPEVVPTPPMNQTTAETNSSDIATLEVPIDVTTPPLNQTTHDTDSSDIATVEESEGVAAFPLKQTTPEPKSSDISTPEVPVDVTTPPLHQIAENDSSDVATLEVPEDAANDSTPHASSELPIQASEEPSSTSPDLATLPLKQTTPKTDSSDIATLEVPVDAANDSTPQGSSGFPIQALAESYTIAEASNDQTLAGDSNIPNVLDNEPQKERSDSPEVDNCGDQQMAEGPSIQETHVNAGTQLPSVEGTSKGKQPEGSNDINDHPMEELPHDTGDHAHREMEGVVQLPVQSTYSHSLSVPAIVVENSDREMNDAEPMHPHMLATEMTPPTNETLVEQPDTFDDIQMTDDPRAPAPAGPQQIEQGQISAAPFSFNGTLNESQPALPIFPDLQQSNQLNAPQPSAEAQGSQIPDEPMGDAAGFDFGEFDFSNNNFDIPPVPSAPQLQIGGGIGGPQISFPSGDGNQVQDAEPFDPFAFDLGPVVQQTMMDFEPSNPSGNPPFPLQHTTDAALNSTASQTLPQFPEQRDRSNRDSQYPDPMNMSEQQYNLQPSQGMGAAHGQLPSQGSIPSASQTKPGGAKTSRPIMQPRRNRARPYDGFPTQMVNPAQPFPAQSITPGFPTASAPSFRDQKTPDNLIDPLLRDLKPEDMKSTSFLTDLEAQSAIHGDAMVQDNSDSHAAPELQKPPERALESSTSPFKSDAQSAVDTDAEMVEVAAALIKEMEAHRLEDEAEAAAEAAAKAAADAAGKSAAVELQGAGLYEWFQKEIAKPSSTGQGSNLQPALQVLNPIISPFNPQSHHTVSAPASNSWPTSNDVPSYSRGICFPPEESSSDDEGNAQPVSQEPRKKFALQGLGRRRKVQNGAVPNQQDNAASELSVPVGGSNHTDGNGNDESVEPNSKQTRTSFPTSSSTNEPSESLLPNPGDLYEQGIRDNNKALRDIKNSKATERDEEESDEDEEPTKDPSPVQMGKKRAVNGSEAAPLYNPPNPYAFASAAGPSTSPSGSRPTYPSVPTLSPTNPRSGNFWLPGLTAASSPSLRTLDPPEPWMSPTMQNLNSTPSFGQPRTPIVAGSSPPTTPGQEPRPELAYAPKRPSPLRSSSMRGDVDIDGGMGEAEHQAMEEAAMRGGEDDDEEEGVVWEDVVYNDGDVTMDAGNGANDDGEADGDWEPEDLDASENFYIAEETMEKEKEEGEGDKQTRERKEEGEEEKRKREVDTRDFDELYSETCGDKFWSRT